MNIVKSRSRPAIRRFYNKTWPFCCCEIEVSSGITGEPINLRWQVITEGVLVNSNKEPLSHVVRAITAGLLNSAIAGPALFSVLLCHGLFCVQKRA